MAGTARPARAGGGGVASTSTHTHTIEMLRSSGLRAAATLRIRPLKPNDVCELISARYGPVTICEIVAVVVPAATFSRSRTVAGSIATSQGIGETIAGVVYPPSPFGIGVPGLRTATRWRRRPAGMKVAIGISGQRRHPVPAEEVGDHGREIM